MKAPWYYTYFIPGILLMMLGGMLFDVFLDITIEMPVGSFLFLIAAFFWANEVQMYSKTKKGE